MKTLPFIALFAVLVLTSSYVSTEIDASTETVAQTGSFKQFRVHRQGNDVALTWSVSISNVAEFVIERSYDGEFFEAIGSRSCAGSATHHYTDVNVFPGTIYYRISAIKRDQSIESSATETVRIVKRG